MTTEKIETLVKQFQNRTLPKEAWTHEAHLIVALWHVCHYSKAEATCLLRAGIINYNVAVGTANTPTGGYHETITLFWIWLIKEFVDKNKELKINELIDFFYLLSMQRETCFINFTRKNYYFQWNLERIGLYLIYSD